MKLDKLLGIKYPIIQGGMAHIATGEFAAKVSEAGGMGMIASGNMKLDKIKREIEICKSLTDKPFGLNIMMLHREIDELARLACEYEIKFITTGAGNPGKYIEQWRSHGISVFPVVSSPALAIRMERIGVNGLVVEGCEAGGHIGELGSMVAIKEISDAVNIPVVAAGGLASGQQILAAQVLGACGVQVGTILLGSRECPIHKNYKNKLISAKSSQVTVIGRINGLPTRVLKNKMARDYIRYEKSGIDILELEKITYGSLKNAVINGDLEKGSVMCGQAVGMIKEEEKLEKILQRLMKEYHQAKEELCQS